MNLQEMREKRAKLIADARKLTDKASTEKRSLTNEEKNQFDTMLKDAGDQKADIERREQLEAEERELNSSAGRKTDAEQPGRDNGAEARNGKSIEVEFRGHKMSFEPGTKEHTLASEQHNKGFRSWLRGEQRTAASFGNDVLADGGYLHAPVQFNAMLLKFLDNNVFVRRNATILPVTTSDTLGTPNLATDVADSAWTTEVAAISADQTAQFTRRDLKPNLLAKLVLVSQKLLRTAAVSPEEIVANRIAYKLAVPEEKGYLTGNGTGQPLGVYTASASGISTGRDVVAGTTTAITADGLIAVKYGLKAQYRPGARWNFHRTAMQAIATLKDSQNRYLWQVGIAPGQPDTLLGFPTDESEYTPNTFTTGLYVGLLANWSYYWIAELVTGFEMQRLNELYAATSQVGFIGRKYVDGAPVVEEAFSRAKLA